MALRREQICTEAAGSAEWVPDDTLNGHDHALAHQDGLDNWVVDYRNQTWMLIKLSKSHFY